MRHAGSIPSAPSAHNVTFYEKHYRRKLVINGVDAQMNANTVGIVRDRSGRYFDGYPTLNALLGARYTAALPIP